MRARHVWKSLYRMADRVSGKQPFGPGRFIRATNKNANIFALRYGEGRKHERLEAMSATGRLCGSHPELVSISIHFKTWRWWVGGGLESHYISDAKEGARRTIRMFPDSTAISISEVRLRRICQSENRCGVILQLSRCRARMGLGSLL